MLFIVLLPALLVLQATASPCKDDQIMNQLRGSPSQLCPMVYTFDKEAQ